MYKRFFKRSIDLVVSIIAFIVLLPVLFLISVVTAMCQGGSNVFFMQERIGYKGRKFIIIKFKTMTDRRDAAGNLLPDADRQTAWGTIMRKCSLDELLQLINVIKGEMSLVGPRPLIESQVSDLSRREKLRFLTKPGITGLAQVCGRNDISFDHKFKYDAWYVRHLSFALDMQIILNTIKVVFYGQGVEYNPSVNRQPEMEYESIED